MTITIQIFHTPRITMSIVHKILMEPMKKCTNKTTRTMSCKSRESNPQLGVPMALSQFLALRITKINWSLGQISPTETTLTK
jgi:hypothetical protein